MNREYQEEIIENNEIYKEDLRAKTRIKRIVIIAIIIAIITFLSMYLKDYGKNDYLMLMDKLCIASLEYQEDNEDIIDTTKPNSVAYITIEELMDGSYISSSPIKDPRRLNILPFLTKYIDSNSKLKIVVASNGEVYCDGLQVKKN